ncbi:polysaccharide deacetylase family protein [Subtercola vilae]|uniref:Polysaccharide deacetylase n=1 Tax=Subtercola vilae TaxID=2056433 RepID=A0A4T2BYL0_9MICO|nr:polysaccharide deacetylase family protein [Subtercola vilae]TIH36182.1 polysaccharide deacetylase [Subtercola vilae]
MVVRSVPANPCPPITAALVSTLGVRVQEAIVSGVLSIVIVGEVEMRSRVVVTGGLVGMPAGRWSRKSRLVAVVIGVGLLAGFAAFGGTAPRALGATAKPLTVVSLTFDDTFSDQLNALASMSKYKVVGTFYMNSGRVGAGGFLTVADLKNIAAAGNEIGGHTVSHPDLPTLTVDEQKRQICNDRVNLTNWGFKVTSFAYPFASSNAQTEQLVAGCGYNSARMLGDIKSRFGCPDCDYASPTPPDDPYATQALDEADNTWTLKDLQDSVTNAETAGGWVQLTFHHVCPNNCDSLSVSTTIFDQFTSWLAARATTGNTHTETVGQVIGGTVKPLVNGPAVPAAGPGQNGVVNPGLETTAASGVPSCWTLGGYGNNTAAFAATTPTHSGVKAEKLTMTNYVDGDGKLLPTLDLGACAPTVTAGHTYSLRTWYNSTAVTQFAVYLRSSLGTWRYWTSSPWFPATTAYTQALWTTPAIPADMTGISFGLNLFRNGTLTTDDYALYDTVGAPAIAGPATAAATPRTAPPVTGRVEIAPPGDATPPK